MLVGASNGKAVSNGEHVDISHESDILKRQFLGHFREARDVFSEIQSDRSEENVENVWSVSLHVEKDIDRQQRAAVRPMSVTQSLDSAQPRLGIQLNPQTIRVHELSSESSTANKCDSVDEL
ncbi:hypothetical protein GQ457_12G000920 [Hibiscus cannabinus]